MKFDFGFNEFMKIIVLLTLIQANRRLDEFHMHQQIQGFMGKAIDYLKDVFVLKREVDVRNLKIQVGLVEDFDKCIESFVRQRERDEIEFA